MLTIATLGLAGYGVYSMGEGLWDLFATRQLELPAVVALVVLGVLLLLAAAFVRAGVPGGLEFAAAMVLALQALALHNASHAPTGIMVVPQLVRGLYGATVLAIGFAYGWRGRGS